MSGSTPIVGTLVVIALIGASLFLFWALRRSLGKVPPSFDDASGTPDDPAPEPWHPTEAPPK
ncbi:MAG: hypothetical protein ACYDAQ_18805 [Mycobacteriales bacterium]